MPSCALPVLIAALLVGACGPPAEVIAMRTSQAEHRARQAYEHDPALRVRAERGIVFEYGACIRYTFDSARRMFVRDQGYSVDEARPREVLRRRDSTRVAWTDADLQAVLADAHRTGLWGYPSDFGDSLSRAPGTESYTTRTPSYRYRADVRDGERTALVRWAEAIVRPLSPEAVRLRAFGERLVARLEAMPEVQALPPASVFCL